MRNVLIGCVLLFAVLGTGCSGITQEEYDALNLQVEALTTEKIALEEQLDFLENGAANQILEIRKSYESKQYQNVIDCATKLHQDFPGTSEDEEAQELASECKDTLNTLAAEKAAEEKKIADEAKKSDREKARAIIQVEDVSCTSPNSAGGVDLHIQYVNKSDKIIKYATFTVEPYNRVGDVVGCEIRGFDPVNAKSVGPYRNGQGLTGGTYGIWECMWYNSTIDSVKLVKIRIEYTDGSTCTLSGLDVDYVQY